MRYIITTIKIISILSMLINSAGQGYALRPMAAGSSTGQGLFDGIWYKVWPLANYHVKPLDYDKLKRYIEVELINAVRTSVNLKERPQLRKKVLEILKPLAAELERTRKADELTQINHSLSIARRVRAAGRILEREGLDAYQTPLNTMTNLYRRIQRLTYPEELLNKIKEFKHKRYNGNRPEELDELLVRLYGVTLGDIIGYMVMMGDDLINELSHWTEGPRTILKDKVSALLKPRRSEDEASYGRKLSDLIKQGLRMEEGKGLTGVGYSEWAMLINYFALKAAEDRYEEKLAKKLYAIPSNVKAAFFDVANVILFEDMRRVARGLAKYCDMKEEEIFEIMEPRGFWADLDRGEIQTEAYFERVKKRLGLRLDYDTFIKIWTDAYEVNHKAVEAIRQLKKAGYKIYIVSNCNKAHREYYCKRYDYIFNMLDGFVASYEQGIMKPDGEIFKRALELFGLNPWEAVVVDDSEENTKAALSLGIASIQYQPGETDLQSELVRLIAPRNGLLTERLTGQESALETHRVVAAFSNAA